MTVETCVCCSMISESQMRYASRVPCHGRSWRPWARCHRMTREENVAGMPPVYLHPSGERLRRLFRRPGGALQRHQGAGLVEMDHGVELVGHVGLEVMALALGLRAVDHADRALQPRRAHFTR